MIEAIQKFAPLLAVLAALIGLAAAVLRRRQTVTYRHEFPHLPTPGPTRPGGASAPPPPPVEVDLGNGASLIGKHLCKGDETIPLDSIRSIEISRTASGAFWGVFFFLAAALMLLYGFIGTVENLQGKGPTSEPEPVPIVEDRVLLFGEEPEEEEEGLGIGWGASCGLGIGGIVALIFALGTWDQRSVHVATLDGKRRRIAKELPSAAARRLRNQILAAK